MPEYSASMLVSAHVGVKRSFAIKFVVVMTFLCAFLVASSGTARAELPTYDGGMTFPDIWDASDPEDYSWEVDLEEDQELVQIDDHSAVVYYLPPSGHVALSISAAPAHDAIGTSVPTTLEVTDGNIVTLTVHHRAGNPKAGGAVFDYPIIAGEGWEGGFQTSIVQMPPAEADPRAQREREAREASEREAFKNSHCVVPSLKGRSLRTSRKLLARSGCNLGRATLRQATSPKNARVVSQSRWTGTVLKPGATVGIRLA
jgi:hypothetical protein